MKKILFATSLISGLWIPSGAQVMTSAQSVKIITPYNVTCSSQQISSTAGTELTGNTSVSSTTAQIFSISILNLSTTANLYCLPNNSSVSASGNNIGIPIIYQPSVSTPYNYLTISIPTWETFYCITNGAAATSALVCKWK